MGLFKAVVAGFLTLALANLANGDEPPAKVPADFKILVSSYRLAKEPVSTEEIVVRDGRAYVFPSDSKEVVIIEPGRKRLELLDVGRKLQAEVSFRSLDESLEKLKVTTRDAADSREKLGGRGNALEAKMTRDLIDPRFALLEGPKAGRLRLTNPSVEVDALGESEEDAPRLAMVAITLGSIARLGAYRTPDDLPPFAELEAIAALTGDRKLMPTELTYLYRLAGPPRKFRRTYRVVPALTARDLEAIARVEQLREVAPTVRYERYRATR